MIKRCVVAIIFIIIWTKICFDYQSDYKKGNEKYAFGFLAGTIDTLIIFMILGGYNGKRKRRV